MAIFRRRWHAHGQHSHTSPRHHMRRTWQEDNSTIKSTSSCMTSRSTNWRSSRWQKNCLMNWKSRRMCRWPLESSKQHLWLISKLRRWHCMEDTISLRRREREEDEARLEEIKRISVQRVIKQLNQVVKMSASSEASETSRTPQPRKLSRCQSKWRAPTLLSSIR